ncbi:hypothetical protein FB45DRAFT_1024089 [Roridomyces roridus]|uniref:SET domain-containing protein n=1 Tax=Roridomyces roridus TaxID=1738132 RepID=A0AAD7C5Q1_9AGAR|nr:hypothetical protein FB45DRAFT_1024089 [Roridomyces roridus]
MTSRTTTTALTIAGLSVCGLVAYAVYFDYRRRTDATFRKQISKSFKRLSLILVPTLFATGKQKKRVDKSMAESREAMSAESEVSEADLREALKLIKSEPLLWASSWLLEAREGFHFPAALSFYRALAVYPSPTDLLAIYKKTVPDPIVKIVVALMDLDLKSKIGAYLEVFPPKRMNVSMEARPENSDTSGPDKVLILTKDVAAGEVIYKEHPLLTVLDYDLQLAGTHCSHCLREIQPALALGSLSLTSSDGTTLAFCSKPCQVASKSRWHALLFTLEPLALGIPELAQLAAAPAALEARRAAQSQLISYLSKDSRVGALLVAKFIARQLTGNKTTTTDAAAGDDYTQSDGGEYNIEDHVERWTPGIVNPPAEEQPLIAGVLKETFPGFETFLPNEQAHKALLGRLVFNAYGVCFGGGREDRPTPTLRPEDSELTRTPYGTSRQIGTAVYTVSAYLPHSCAPNARPSLSSGTSELQLIAIRDLKKGEELSVAYIDVNQHHDEGETTSECRLRRRKELARGWRFACRCSRCAKEAVYE